jgi:hypothetical protein
MEYKRMWMPDEENICLKKYRNKNLIIEHKTTNKGNDSGILKDWEAASKNKLPHWCYTKQDYKLLDQDWRKRNYSIEEGKWVLKKTSDNSLKSNFEFDKLLYNYHVFENNNNLIDGFSLPTFEDFKNASDTTLKNMYETGCHKRLSGGNGGNYINTRSALFWTSELIEESEFYPNHAVCAEIAKDLSIEKKIEPKGTGLCVRLISNKRNL